MTDGPGVDVETFRPIRSRRTFEEAVEQIADAITAGRLRPGDRLPSERALADALQVGRPTVREALGVLVDAKVLEYVGSGRGAGVRVISDMLPTNLVEDRTELRVTEIGGVLVARRMLEPRIAQLAAVQRADDDVERMHRMLGLQRAAVHDRGSFLELDLRWHLEVARCTHNATLIAMQRVLVRRLEKAYDLALRSEMLDAERALHDHTAVTRAIAGHDPDAAARAMEEHLTILEAQWEDESGIAFHRKLPDFLVRDDES